MSPWCEAFREEVSRREEDQQALAKQLRVAPSTLGYWLRGSVPRKRKRAHVERWSDGRVPSQLAEA